MSRLWGPGSTTRPAPRTPAAETAVPRNHLDLDLGDLSCQWQRTIWPIIDCPLRFLLWWLPQAWWGSPGQNQWRPPHLPDPISYLERLPILESEHPSSQQTPPRSSRQGRCCRTWCWGNRGLQAPNQSWLQLQLRPLHQLPNPPLYRFDSSPDRRVQGMWPRCGGPCPLKDRYLWNPNGLPMSTWSHSWGQIEDLPFLPRESMMVSLSGLFAQRFVIM